MQANASSVRADMNELTLYVSKMETKEAMMEIIEGKSYRLETKMMSVIGQEKNDTLA